MADVQDNIVIGHTHRMGIHYERTVLGVPHVAANFGWLGDPKQIDYLSRAKAMREWMHGFGIGRWIVDRKN